MICSQNHLLTFFFLQIFLVFCLLVFYISYFLYFSKVSFCTVWYITIQCFCCYITVSFYLFFFLTHSAVFQILFQSKHDSVNHFLLLFLKMLLLFFSLLFARTEFFHAFQNITNNSNLFLFNRYLNVGKTSFFFFVNASFDRTFLTFR